MRDGAGNGASSLTRDDFRFVRELLRRYAALVLDEEKDYLVEARLEPLAALEGYGSSRALLDALRSGAALDLRAKIIEAMDIHETSFFRDWKPFEALRASVIPRLVEARARRRELVFWSAACSTGQEPYSVAMLLREHFPELAGWTVRIYATDISNEALDKARAGRYGQLEINRGLPAPMLVKYFQRDGADWQLSTEIRSMVEFRQANLAAAGWRGLPPVDVVLLRNVLIYFDLETRRHVVSGIRRLLQPDGRLLLGSAETMLGVSNDFVRDPLAGGSSYALREGA